jgi:2-dehydro-3-deoxygluconokinase
MIELRERPDGALARGHGGDTLNTAVYLARLGVAVDYVTALGDDAWSEEMLAHWQAEGIGTAGVRRLPGRLPGLYIIQTDPAGERRFLYWRDSAAARALFDGDAGAAVAASLADYDLLYLSGITLSIFHEDARARLFGGLRAQQARGGRVVFDTNFRSRGWPDRTRAQALYREAFALADLLFASEEDLLPLFGDAGEAELIAPRRGRETVLKLARPCVRVMLDGTDSLVEAPPVSGVVDTTAAGDSFSAAYLAARRGGLSPVQAAAAGHRLAGAVVRHPGAIIPRDAMPEP